MDEKEKKEKDIDNTEQTENKQEKVEGIDGKSLPVEEGTTAAASGEEVEAKDPETVSDCETSETASGPECSDANEQNQAKDSFKETDEAVDADKADTQDAEPATERKDEKGEPSADADKSDGWRFWAAASMLCVAAILFIIAWNIRPSNQPELYTEPGPVIETETEDTGIIDENTDGIVVAITDGKSANDDNAGIDTQTESVAVPEDIEEPETEIPQQETSAESESASFDAWEASKNVNDDMQVYPERYASDASNTAWYQYNAADVELIQKAVVCTSQEAADIIRELSGFGINDFNKVTAFMNGYRESGIQITTEDGSEYEVTLDAYNDITAVKDLTNNKYYIAAENNNWLY